MTGILKVVVGTAEFALSVSQIYKVEGNLFQIKLEDGTYTRETRKLWVDRHPECFPFVQEYLSGRDVFPISEETARFYNLPLELLVQYLKEDADYYRLPDLAVQAKIELLRIAQVKAASMPSATTDSILFKLDLERMQYRLEKKKLEFNLSVKKLEIGASSRRLKSEERMSSQKAQAELERDTAILKLITEQKSSFWSRFRSSGAKNCLHVSLGCCHTGCHEPRRGADARNAPTVLKATLAPERKEYAGPFSEPRTQSAEHTAGKPKDGSHSSGPLAGASVNEADDESITWTESVHMLGGLSPSFRSHQAAKFGEHRPGSVMGKAKHDKHALFADSEHVDAHLPRIEEAIGRDPPKNQREGPQERVSISARAPGVGRTADNAGSSKTEDGHLCNESRFQGFPMEGTAENSVTVSQARQPHAAHSESYSPESEGRLSPSSEARQPLTAEQKGKYCAARPNDAESFRSGKNMHEDSVIAEGINASLEQNSRNAPLDSNGAGPSRVRSKSDHSTNFSEVQSSNRAERAIEEASQQIIEPRAVKERALVLLSKIRQNQELPEKHDRQQQHDPHDYSQSQHQRQQHDKYRPRQGNQGERRSELEEVAIAILNAAQRKWPDTAEKMDDFIEDIAAYLQRVLERRYSDYTLNLLDELLETLYRFPPI